MYGPILNMQLVIEKQLHLENIDTCVNTLSLLQLVVIWNVSF